MLPEYAFFIACLIAGEIWARRQDTQPRRWHVNLSLLGLLWLTGLALGRWLDGQPEDLAGDGIGLLGLLDAGPAVTTVLTCVAYDLYSYWKHRLMHAVPWLWRVHAVHHSDPGFDASTHFRHHPLDILLSLPLLAGFVLLVGPEPVALALAMALHHYNSVLNHSNIALPVSLDRVLRLFIVTPDMHRIHHSARREETDSNFANLLSCWDRLFGTFVAAPRGGQGAFELGLHEYTRAGRTRLWDQLCGPFTVRFATGRATGAAARSELERP
jgi:sterol desaturase/sphingolipid hydroxylase (fatty acid hydroxylase superfamily)